MVHSPKTQTPLEVSLPLLSSHPLRIARKPLPWYNTSAIDSLRAPIRLRLGEGLGATDPLSLYVKLFLNDAE